MFMLLTLLACASKDQTKEEAKTSIEKKEKKENLVAKIGTDDIAARKKMVMAKPADFISTVTVAYDKTKLPITLENITLQNSSEFELQVYAGMLLWMNAEGVIGVHKLQFLGADTPGLWLPANGQNEISSDFFETEAVDKLPTRVEFTPIEIKILAE